MILPVQATPIIKVPHRFAAYRKGVIPHDCSWGDEIKCGFEAAGVGAACAITAPAGPAIVGCLAAAAGFVADCHDCAAAAPLQGAICFVADMANRMSIPVPDSILSWCNL